MSDGVWIPILTVIAPPVDRLDGGKVGRVKGEWLGSRKFHWRYPIGSRSSECGGSQAWHASEDWRESRADRPPRC